MNATTLSGGAEIDEKWHVGIVVDDYTASVAGVAFAVGVVVALFAVFVCLKVKACRRRKAESPVELEQEASDDENKDRDLV